MDIRITPAQPEDARGITELMHQTWLATYPNESLDITREDIDESYREALSEERIKRDEEKLRNIPANQKRVVAKDGDQVVGIAMMFKSENNNELKSLYVLPLYQGQGIGKMLWEAVRDFVDPSKDIVIEVADYTQQAIKFYEKLGFVDTGKRWKDEQWKLKSGAYVPLMEMVLKN